MRLGVACLLVLSFAVSCASSPSPRAAATPARMQESAPEKAAAQRAAAGNLQLEQEDARWGFEPARARRSQTEAAKKAPPPPPAPKESAPP